MHLTTVDLDEQGRLRAPGSGHTVPGDRIAEHLARHLRVPDEVTDLYVYVHGWQTAPPAAARRASLLLAPAQELHAARPALYPGPEKWTPAASSVAAYGRGWHRPGRTPTSAARSPRTSC
ncbi:hypothetical protein [Streptomyces sp. NPDC007264]|uniref:hypothetical protein n=1 Tax=Streptomyces sp. NPDC007264 TaxID=3364777 RepID=UPI0036DA88B6